MKSALFAAYKTDKTAEVKGVDVVVGINEDESEISFCLARMGNYNKAYGKAFAEESKPHAKAMEANALPDAVAESIMLNTFIDTVLKGWKNVFDEEGNKLEYSKEAARKLMQDLPDLYADLQAKARNMATFKVATLEAVAKN